MKKNSVFPAMVMAVTATVSVGFASISPRVIYGEDNRKEPFEVQDARQRDIAESTVALISKSNLSRQANGSYKLISSSFGKAMGLCKDEPYFEQPSAANCSGSLVGEDLVATAGHCISEMDCKDYNFVFGYKMSSSAAAPDVMRESDVYSCKEIVSRELTRQQDYALVRLDRPVVNRRPLTVATSAVQPQDEIYVVGHPSGLPTKVADGAKVRSLDQGFFIADLDTYGGNSGSAVFSARTHEIVGILVRGAQDFRYDSVNKCTRSNVCHQDGCRGEDVTDISFISQALKQ